MKLFVNRPFDYSNNPLIRINLHQITVFENLGGNFSAGDAREETYLILFLFPNLDSLWQIQ